ncbi:MAG: chemotaxis-specific protein-glutamate methyltransferase CheB [Candidatus Limnocylindrales bacterium]|nr:chemotaxis-specific protein-glutamate methyltransferase CheB [Candidatus Limnocylindrales bacterium]
MTGARRIRTVIVDDSAVARQLLHWMLTQAGDFEVVDAVADGERALERVASIRPDLVTMDLHLPGMDGLEVTRRIMQRSPTPIAIVAASANLDDAIIFEALAAGALAAVQRPLAPGQPDYLKRRRRLLSELRTIARATFADVSRRPATDEPLAAPRPVALADATPRRTTPERLGRPAIALIAVATSTGGPQALRVLLSGLPPVLLPPILIVQHIADGFAAGLAGWLGSVAPGPVRVASDGEQLTSGTTLIAPDDRHLTVTPDGRVRLVATAPVGGHRPSASVLFESTAEAFGASALGIVLTGMGRDGADGLLRIRQAGGLTIAEDPATAVVGGMPGAAIALGAVDHVLPLAAIGPSLTTVLNQPNSASITDRPIGRSTS